MSWTAEFRLGHGFIPWGTASHTLQFHGNDARVALFEVEDKKGCTLHVFTVID